MPAQGLRRRRARSASLLAGLVTFGLASAAAQAEYWQLRRAGATIVVEGDRKFADRTMERVLLLQGTARLLFAWPADFTPRPVLALVVDQKEIERVFESAPFTTSEQTLMTPGLAVVAAPLVPAHRRELEQFQQAYGAALLEEPPTAGWPECARIGFRMVFTAAEYTARNHLYVGTQAIVPYEPLMPDQFLADPASPPTMLYRDRRGYSCFLLDLMLVTGDTRRRAAIGQLYAALAAGAPLAAAIPEDLGGTIPTFVTLFRAAAPRVWENLRFLDVKADLPLPNTIVAQADRMTHEQVEAMLKSLCTKLLACRGAARAAPH